MTLVSPASASMPENLSTIMRFKATMVGYKTNARTGALEVVLSVVDEDIEFGTKVRHLRGHELYVDLRGDELRQDLVANPKVKRTAVDKALERINRDKAERES